MEENNSISKGIIIVLIIAMALAGTLLVTLRALHFNEKEQNDTEIITEAEENKTTGEIMDESKLDIAESINNDLEDDNVAGEEQSQDVSTPKEEVLQEENEPKEELPQNDDSTNEEFPQDKNEPEELSQEENELEENTKGSASATNDLSEKRAEIERTNGFGYEVGQLLPNFEAWDESGECHTLEEFLGKPLYINLFTTWCGPCNMEMPELQKVHSERDEECNFLLIEFGESWREINEFKEYYNLTMPVYSNMQDMFGTYPVYSIPQQFVIDRYGRIVATEMGSVSEDWMNYAVGLAVESN